MVRLATCTVYTLLHVCHDLKKSELAASKKHLSCFLKAAFKRPHLAFRPFAADRSQAIDPSSD